MRFIIICKMSTAYNIVLIDLILPEQDVFLKLIFSVGPRRMGKHAETKKNPRFSCTPAGQFNFVFRARKGRII